MKERDQIRFVARVPDRLNLKVEFEIEDDGTELEIELTWSASYRLSARMALRATPGARRAMVRASRSLRPG